MLTARYFYTIPIIIIAISTYQITQTYQQMRYIKMDLHQHTKIFDARTEWMTWNKAHDHQKYCKAWLFNQNPASIIHLQNETTDDQTIMCEFMIHNINVDSLKTPPFGHISIIEQNHDTVKIRWFMNMLINNNLLCPHTSMQLTLSSVILIDGIWHIELNGHWIQINQTPYTHVIDSKYALNMTQITHDAVSLYIIKSNGEKQEYSMICNQAMTLEFV